MCREEEGGATEHGSAQATLPFHRAKHNNPANPITTGAPVTTPNPNPTRLSAAATLVT